VNPTQRFLVTQISNDVIATTIFGYARLFDAPGQAVIATRVDGSIIYWSSGAAELYGWGEDEVLGLNILQVTPSEAGVEHADAIMSNLRAGRTWSGSFRVKHRDGSELVVQVRDLPVRDDSGVLIGVVGVSFPAPGQSPEEETPLASD